MPKRKSMRRGSEEHQQGQGMGFAWAGKPQGIGERGKARQREPHGSKTGSRGRNRAVMKTGRLDRRCGYGG